MNIILKNKEVKMNIPVKKLGFMIVAITFNCYAVTNISIDDAIRKNIITTDVTCKGGLVLDYKIKNLTNDSLKIVLPSGWRINSVKEGYQDILVAHDQIFAMKKNEIKSFEVKGYCCEYTNSGPTKGLKYESGNLADSKLLLLSKYLNAEKSDANTEQYAVWAVSNNRPTANITGANDSITEKLRHFVASVKGEPIPWYTLRKKAVITGNGTISDYPIQLKAKVSYSNEKACYSYLFVLDSLGNKVGEIIGQWLLPGTNEYSVNLNVKAFKKGKYKMLLAWENKEFITKDFEI